MNFSTDGLSTFMLKQIIIFQQHRLFKMFVSKYTKPVLCLHSVMALSGKARSGNHVEYTRTY